jgi:hypothetical protein
MVRRAAFLFAVSLVAACAPGSQEDNAVSSADVVSGSSAATPKAKNKPKKEVDQPLIPIYVDPDTGAEVAPPEGVGPSGALSIDGQPCTVDNVKLEVPVSTAANGWTLTMNAHCPGGVSFQASGVFDAAYPQSNVIAFGSTEAATLTVASADGSSTGTFTTSDLGSSTITAGPTSGAPATVMGGAVVADADTLASHEVDYSVVY